ncbi:MAG: hypothetical protein Athens041674_179 [Parcubacteria group bacterium Athens0416_74]|nr:MAG: hypothetical protein Athens041674_179 [Parcubacteria group bacterium Athens0416_74]
MVDVIGGPDGPDLTVGVLAVQRQHESKAATGVLCPEHPNCWGELVLRAATDLENQEIVFLEARKSEMRRPDAWRRFRGALTGEEEKIRQLLADGKLKKKPGPKGLFLLYHIEEKG